LRYEDLLDAEMTAYLARSAEFYPPDAVSLSVEEQRQVYDAMAAAFHQGYPEGITAEDMQAGGVPVRVYSGGAPTATVLYFHGGGFVVGGLESHDDICAEICAGSGFRVVSVDYRLSPEHVHPAAFDDARTAVLWALEAYEGPVVLAGDSAGGNLAAAVTHALRAEQRIVGQLLIYPGLGGDMTQGTYVTHAEAPGLTSADVSYYSDIRAGGAAPMNDPSFAPLQDTDFSGLPPTVIVTAEYDPLSGDGMAYRDAILKAGGRAFWRDE
jgi:acetyl esterase